MSMDDSSPRCRLLLICGSLRSGSTNTALLKTAQTLVPPGVSATLYRGLDDLPHFNPDDEQSRLPAAVATLRAMLAAADAVLFSTPEYAGSLPGSFKNLLDWTVGDGLYAKPVGWINGSAHGAADGAHHTLRVVLGYVSADIVEDACVKIPIRRDIVGPNGTITDPSITSAINAVLSALVHRVNSRST
jgi:chromate reductase, NAD(P)H dehydrogenase (quinone)